MPRLKYLAVLFLPIFAVAFVVGTINGIDQRQARAKTEIFGRVSAIYKGDAVYLKHECNGAITHVYSVDTRKISKALPFLLEKPGGDSDLLASTLPHRGVVISLLGGVSAGVTLTQISRLFAAERSRSSVIVTIAAGISGYLLGYRFGERGLLPCDSAAVSQNLDREDIWRELGRWHFVLTLYAMGHDIPDGYWERHEDERAFGLPPVRDPLFSCAIPVAVKFRGLVVKAEDLSYLPKSVDYIALRRLIADYKRITQLPEYSLLGQFRPGPFSLLTPRIESSRRKDPKELKVFENDTEQPERDSLQLGAAGQAPLPDLHLGMRPIQKPTLNEVCGQVQLAFEKGTRK